MMAPSCGQKKQFNGNAEHLLHLKLLKLAMGRCNGARGAKMLVNRKANGARTLVTVAMK